MPVLDVATGVCDTARLRQLVRCPPAVPKVAVQPVSPRTRSEAESRSNESCPNISERLVYGSTRPGQTGNDVRSDLHSRDTQDAAPSSPRAVVGRILGQALTAVISIMPWRANRNVTKPWPSRGIMLPMYAAIGMIVFLAIKKQVIKRPRPEYHQSGPSTSSVTYMVNEVSGEAMEERAEAELLRLQREETEHRGEAARAARATAQAGPAQYLEPEAQQADGEVVFLMERLRVDICTNRPLTGTSVAEDSVAQGSDSAVEARNNEEVYLEVDPLEEKDEEWEPTLAPPAVGPRHAPSDSRDSTVPEEPLLLEESQSSENRVQLAGTPASSPDSACEGTSSSQSELPKRSSPLQFLRFLTLNVNTINGDGNQRRRETLMRLMRMDEWDVVFLQETHHSGDSKRPPPYAKDFEECGYEGYWGSGNTTGYGGVAILISKKAEMHGLSVKAGWEKDAKTDGLPNHGRAQGRLLCLPVTIFDMPHVLVNLHMPSLDKKQARRVFIEALGAALGRYRGKTPECGDSLPPFPELVVGGDFNGVLDELDILPKPASGKRRDERITQHKPVTALLESHGAVDIWRQVFQKAPSFTFKYGSEKKPHGGSRLDTFALTRQATKRVVSMEHLLGYPGGHFGVSLCLLRPFTIKAEWLPKQLHRISSINVSRAFAGSFKVLGNPDAWFRVSMHRSQTHFQGACLMFCKATKAKLRFQKAALHFNKRETEKLNKAGEAFRIAHGCLQDRNMFLATCG